MIHDERLMRNTQESFISISNFTKEQNEWTAEFAAGLQEQEEKDGDGDAAQLSSRQLQKTSTNFDLLKETSKQVKLIINQANQILTTYDQMHTELFIDKGTEDPTPGVPLREQSHVLSVSTFEMFKNMQLSFKIKVQGEGSPLKFKLEYFDTNLGKVLNHKQLIQFRGSIDIFVSRSTDNPQQVFP